MLYELGQTYATVEHSNRVDATTARRIIDGLHDAGFTWAQIGQACGGHAASWAFDIRSKRRWVTPATDRAVKAAAARLLHGDEISRSGRRTDAHLTMRRLQVLALAGWDCVTLEEITGISQYTLRQVRAGKVRSVRVATAVAVARTYRQIHLTAPPDRARAWRARQQAVRAGWAPLQGGENLDGRRTPPTEENTSDDEPA